MKDDTVSIVLTASCSSARSRGWLWVWIARPLTCSKLERRMAAKDIESW